MTELGGRRGDCGQCGHVFEAHKIFLPPDPNRPSGMRAHGWMTCPQYGCDCFQTLSFHNGNRREPFDLASCAIAEALMHCDISKLDKAMLLAEYADVPPIELWVILEALPHHVVMWWRNQEHLDRIWHVGERGD